MILVPYPPFHPIIRRELAVMKRAAARINSSPQSARAFLLKHGFITSGGRLTKRYS